MSLAIVQSRAQVGIQAPAVSVEVNLAGGLPKMSIVGLPETVVKESKDRVRAALQNSGFEVPARRITVSLAPADLPKDGGRFDLAIALGILAASRQINAESLAAFEFLGELSLSGELRATGGILPAALAAADCGHALIVPTADADEAALVSRAETYAAEHLLKVCAHLHQREQLPACADCMTAAPDADDWQQQLPDLADVRGQHQARRALEIAAAGNHNLLLVGPPGTGKTMLASRLPGIMPELTDSQALEAAAVASISGQKLHPGSWKQRRFRHPHHTCSGVALVGGGSHPRPGEISLAHHGVLFLDELPEFDRRVLEVLREPMESGSIIISRAARQAEFPARFQLVAAMNPCPCGYAGDALTARCRCTGEQISRYRSRLSGPLLDRIDMQIEVPRLPHRQLHGQAPAGESSNIVRARVQAAHQRQMQRSGCSNAHLPDAAMREHCQLSAKDQNLLERAADKLQLSARAWQRILKVARSIADLDASAPIQTRHLSEAINYRRLRL